MTDVQQNIQVTDSSKKVRKIKKVKEGPIKYKSSYLHFCINERQKVVLENPSIKNTDIVTEIAKRWNVLKQDPSSLKKFEDLALQDKERYTREMESWVKTAAPAVQAEQPPQAQEDAPVAAKKKRAPKKAAASQDGAVTETPAPVPTPVAEEELLEEEVVVEAAPEPVAAPAKKAVVKKTVAKKK
jgi:hypothetical protein